MNILSELNNVKATIADLVQAGDIVSAVNLILNKFRDADFLSQFTTITEAQISLCECREMLVPAGSEEGLTWAGLLSRAGIDTYGLQQLSLEIDNLQVNHITIKGRPFFVGNHKTAITNAPAISTSAPDRLADTQAANLTSGRAASVFARFADSGGGSPEVPDSSPSVAFTDRAHSSTPAFTTQSAIDNLKDYCASWYQLDDKLFDLIDKIGGNQ